MPKAGKQRMRDCTELASFHVDTSTPTPDIRDAISYRIRALFILALTSLAACTPLYTVKAPLG